MLLLGDSKIDLKLQDWFLKLEPNDIWHKSDTTLTLLRVN